jgi:hypothetical protein
VATSCVGVAFWAEGYQRGGATWGLPLEPARRPRMLRPRGIKKRILVLRVSPPPFLCPAACRGGLLRIRGATPTGTPAEPYTISFALFRGRGSNPPPLRLPGRRLELLPRSPRDSQAGSNAVAGFARNLGGNFP